MLHRSWPILTFESTKFCDVHRNTTPTRHSRNVPCVSWQHAWSVLIWFTSTWLEPKHTWKLPSWELITISIHIPDRFSWDESMIFPLSRGRYVSWRVPSGVIIWPTQTCTIRREIPQNYHIFALLDAPKMANLITPDHCLVSMLNFGAVSIHLWIIICQCQVS